MWGRIAWPTKPFGLKAVFQPQSGGWGKIVRRPMFLAPDTRFEKAYEMLGWRLRLWRIACEVYCCIPSFR